MKNLNKLTAFFLFILFSYGVDTFSYTYTVANMTGENVKVQLYYAFGKLGKAKVIVTDAMHKFSFKGLIEGPKCLSKIKASRKKLGKWGKQKKVRVSGFAGLTFGECKNVNFILKVDNSIFASIR